MIYFCIPSYKRAFEQRTLEYLESIGIKKEQIYISKQTQEDYKEYIADMKEKLDYYLTDK